MPSVRRARGLENLDAMNIHNRLLQLVNLMVDLFSKVDREEIFTVIGGRQSITGTSYGSWLLT